MADDILTRLRYVHYDDADALMHEAADAIERLQTALALAVGELSTHGQYTSWTPEMLMNQFLEEARHG